jgi:hypothetical protein
MSIIMGNAVIDALLETGIVTKDQRVRRVVIDVQIGEPVVMHVERFGDERVLQVLPALRGTEIRLSPAEALDASRDAMKAAMAVSDD